MSKPVEIQSYRPPPRNLGGRNPPIEVAMARGYTHVVLAPSGHAISNHRSEKEAKKALRDLRAMGCKIVPIAEALAT